MFLNGEELSRINSADNCVNKDCVNKDGVNKIGKGSCSGYSIIITIIILANSIPINVLAIRIAK